MFPLSMGVVTIIELYLSQRLSATRKVLMTFSTVPPAIDKTTIVFEKK